MKRILNASTILCLSALWIAAWQPLASAQTEPGPQVAILALDPVPPAVLAENDRLHLQIHYQSQSPLRLQATALRQGKELEVGLKSNPGYLHTSGEGEALAWLSFSNPTHIDEVQIRVMDIEWQEIDRISTAVEVNWRGHLDGQAKEPADWVKTLTKQERRKLDFVYDPIPNKQESLFDLIFLITVGTTPVYILLQIYMLRKYRGRWRELAAIPMIATVPMLIYALIGLGITTQQWIAIVFRCAPFALAYLVALWLIKWLRTRNLQA